VILLDTNALIWVEQNHRRVGFLRRTGHTLYLSPASLLELQFLGEANRIRLPKGSLDPIVHDDRWVLDDPPAVYWFEGAVELSWTRDPFDRLLAAHAKLRNWRLATADTHLLQHLGPAYSIEI
jgi:PIN domain nuclease of toxin-antitoxin system